jgi:hypothetical protein
MVAGHEFVVHHRRRVVARVLAREGRVRHDRRAQGVVGVQVGAAHALVHHLLHDIVASHRTFMPTLRNTTTMPVS